MSVRFTLFLVLFLDGFAFSQSINNSISGTPTYKIQWNLPTKVQVSETETIQLLSFDGAQYDHSDDYLPRFSQKITLSGNEQSFSASISNPIYDLLSNDEIALLKNSVKIENQIIVQTSVLSAQKSRYSMVSFVPIRKNPLSGKFEKLISFELLFGSGSVAKSGSRSIRTYASNSVLQSGEWYKIAIAADGIYKLSYVFLRELGIDMSSLNPQKIRIYGNGGGMLSELNSDPRTDDLAENAILVQGEGDGVFNESDYVLFYGKGPNTWSYNSAACPKFQHTLNLYSDSAYYFINVDQGNGKRIQNQASSGLAVTNSVSSFDDYAFHELESTNFIKSGRLWFGEYFENNPSNNFTFSFPNIDGSSQASVKASIASRCLSSNAIYSISSQSGGTSINIGSTIDGISSNYAVLGSGCYSFNPNNSDIIVNVTKQTSDAIAWLNYLEVNVRRQLVMTGAQMNFRDSKSLGSGKIAQYNLTSSLPIQLWDVTDITNIKQQEITVSGTNHQFVLPSDNLRQFVAYTGSSFYTPSISGKVANQNLHALSNKKFIIVAHPDFYNEANQLAAHHENMDGLTTLVVTPQEIYNEFSSGSKDISAIRDFVKMFYDKAGSAAEMPKYLLLFGDGSYDNKMRFSTNTNFIPTYQSDNSTIPTASYVSDDFYGLLDDNEGLWNADAVDIGIGRFPVKSKSEAQAAVNKVLNYTKTGVPTTETSINSCSNQASGSSFGSWRNTICFIGDDQDGGLHTQQADQLATLVDTTYSDYNIDKIYLDAFQQEARPGGNRYPGVVDAINKRVDKGALIINYTGHGGELGLAHERIVEISQINKWTNKDRLFLLYTASCEVSRYDDAERTSAGEYAFLNPNGGAIALFSTVRVVIASDNFYLNRDFYRAAFKPINGKMPTLGDLYQFSKTQPGGNSVNSRNFTLLGDPALRLAYPKYDIATDSINNVGLTSASLDTIKALSVVTVSGHVKDDNGSPLTTFNGILYPTVYDKYQNITTLSNDNTGPDISPPITFKLQKNILYNGKVSVNNGYFKFSFIVPKDIAYQYGFGRISYYAENGNEDANGAYEKILIGGSNDAAVPDAAGPEVKLYLNDVKFVYGGLTDENPDLYSILKDDNGINTVGSGIGHDIMAVLDGNVEGSIVLNDYYQADLNSYKSGAVRYPFTELSEGKHSLKFKVWDVYNNSSESYTEFIVAKSAKLALSHVLNYPNPFTTRTQFYFEHNRACTTLDVQVQVFTVSGKLVKTISRYVSSEGFRSEPIEWDGRDDFGDKIGRGVYVYRVKVKSSDGSVAEKYEKLVILN